MARFHVFHFFFFNDTATTEIYTLSLHDALPILTRQARTFLLNAPDKLRRANTASKPPRTSREPAGSGGCQTPCICHLLPRTASWVIRECFISPNEGPGSRPNTLVRQPPGRDPILIAHHL